MSAVLYARVPDPLKQALAAHAATRGPNCGRALTELLAPAPRAGLNQSAYLALLGALGLLTGLALASADEPGE